MCGKSCHYNSFSVLDFFSAPADSNLMADPSGPVANYLAAYPPPLDEPLRYLPSPPSDVQYELYQQQASSPQITEGRLQIMKISVV